MQKTTSSSNSQFLSQSKVQSYSGTKSRRRSKLSEYLNKSYVLIRSEKYEQFLVELGAKEETLKSAIKIQPTFTLKKEKDFYVLVTSFPGFPEQIIKFKAGEVNQTKLQNGTIVKSLFDITENTIKEVQEWEDKQVIISRNFVKNAFIVSMEINGVKCFRHYKQVPSK